jgi:glycerol-3-phosphate acyltransferase PlsY
MIVLLVAVLGYLIGSLSSARIIAYLVAPGRDITSTRLTLPDGQELLESDVVSPTTLRLHLGRRYGCLAAVFDISKVAVPALALKLSAPDTYYYTLFSATATVGHIWPIYYRFQGGRGLSPITGGFLVMDWVGTLVTNLAGSVFGLARKEQFMAGMYGSLLMIPWTWFWSRDWVLVVYVVAMNLLFWGTMSPIIRDYFRLKRAGGLDLLRRAKVADGGPEAETLEDDDLARLLDRLRGRRQTEHSDRS